VTVIRGLSPEVIPVSLLVQGDQILTLDEAGRDVYTRVLDVVSSSASSPALNSSFFDFVHVELEDGRYLEVTAEHGLVVDGRLVHARSLKVGASLMTFSGRGSAGISRVKAVTARKKPAKVTVSTEAGTALANGVLTSTQCGETFRDGDELPEAVSKWKKAHAEAKVKAGETSG
jgi:hypothetical protein